MRKLVSEFQCLVSNHMHCLTFSEFPFDLRKRSKFSMYAAAATPHMSLQVVWLNCQSLPNRLNQSSKLW